MKRLKSFTNKKSITLFCVLILAIAAVSCSRNGIEENELNEPKSEAEFEGNSDAREDWFNKQRSYPFEKVPENARQKAWEARPAVDQKMLLGGNQWTPVGPLPTTSDIPNWGLTSGRINVVVVSPTDPNLILVGGSTGGIWRSTNGGTNFTAVSDGQVDLAVGSIAFAPSNPTIIYAGMGDKTGRYLGSGVLKSTDSGATWVRISNATLRTPGGNSKIVVHPTNPNIVYVAQYVGKVGGQIFTDGFYYSTDGGVSWTQTLTGGARDMVQHPTQANTLYIAMSSSPGGAGVYKSTDAGLTWNRVYASPFGNTSNIKVATTPAAPSNVFVLIGDGATARVEKSVDDGATFTNLGLGSGFDAGQFSYNCYLHVNTADANTIYVGTRDLWRSTDGGVNYSNITNNFTLAGGYQPFQSKAHPDQHNLYQTVANPGTIYIANDGGLYRSTDNAATFTSLNGNLSLTQFVGIDLHPTDANRTYGGAQDNGSQRRMGTSNWREFTSGDGGNIVIDPLDPSIVFTTYIFKDITRWIDNTDTRDIQVGTCSNGCTEVFGGDPVAFYPPFEGNGVNSNLYFGTNRLWVSTNRGTNWNAPGGATVLTNGGFVSAIGVSKSNLNTIYTGSDDGKLMVSTNGGVAWTDRSNGIPNRTIKSVVVNPTNPNIAYITLSGFLSGHVFKTTDGGANWADISGNLPDIPTNILLIDPNSPTTLYVGTDIGVFRSTTDGTTWNTFTNGMPPVIVTDLDSQPNGLIQAATYGRGVYQINTATAAPRKSPTDFDGDGKTDISIFRPSVAEWYYLRSGNNVVNGAQFGGTNDKPVAADYTGDGKTDIAFFRPGTGEWFVIRSQDSSYYAFPFGTAGDIPSPGDFDGDGKADVAVFRPSNGVWYINKSSGGVTITTFGTNGDRPVQADYDGDGKTDVAIYRPSVGEWYYIRSIDSQVRGNRFGTSTDKTVQGDYTGDGKADFAFFRPADGNWYVLRSEDSSFFASPFGAGTDIPTIGDYDGDGKFDQAVFRPSNGVWYVNRSTAGVQIQQFGNGTDIPVPSTYLP
jgi:photosystem II stability/assembly factor-like uncharacterized protein